MYTIPVVTVCIFTWQASLVYTQVQLVQHIKDFLILFHKFEKTHERYSKTAHLIILMLKNHLYSNVIEVDIQNFKLTVSLIMYRSNGETE